MRDGLTMVARDDDAFARATPSSPFGDTFWHRVHSAVARVREARLQPEPEPEPEP